MPMISIVTPFSGETGHLLGDYYQAVQGSAQVVTVDSAGRGVLRIVRPEEVGVAA